MIGPLARDEELTLRLAAHAVVHQRGLHRGVHRFGPRVDEEHAVQASGRVLDHPVGQLEGLGVGAQEGGGEVQGLQLLVDRLGDFAPAVAGRHAEQARRGVNHLLALGRVEVHALGAGKQLGLGLELLVGGEGHPVRLRCGRAVGGSTGGLPSQRADLALGVDGAEVRFGPPGPAVVSHDLAQALQVGQGRLPQGLANPVSIRVVGQRVPPHRAPGQKAGRTGLAGIAQRMPEAGGQAPRRQQHPGCAAAGFAHRLVVVLHGRRARRIGRRQAGHGHRAFQLEQVDAELGPGEIAHAGDHPLRLLGGVFVVVRRSASSGRKGVHQQLQDEGDVVLGAGLAHRPHQGLLVGLDGVRRIRPVPGQQLDRIGAQAADLRHRPVGDQPRAPAVGGVVIAVLLQRDQQAAAGLQIRRGGRQAEIGVHQQRAGLRRQGLGQQGLDLHDVGKAHGAGHDAEGAGHPLHDGRALVDGHHREQALGIGQPAQAPVLAPAGQWPGPGGRLGVGHRGLSRK